MADQFSGAGSQYPAGSFYKDLADRIAALEAVLGTAPGAVPDGSITAYKLAAGAVSEVKLASALATKINGKADAVMASQAEAEAGVDNNKLITSLRTKQAVVAGKSAYIHVRDQKASGTDGGTSVTGLNIRVLNTVVHNGIAGASLASNKVTLPAGTYFVTARVPGYTTGRHHAWLRTDTGTILAIGGGSYGNPSSFVENDTNIIGKFTIASQSNVEVIHYIQNGYASQGLGIAGSSGSIAEVFTDMIIEKVD